MQDRIQETAKDTKRRLNSAMTGAGFYDKTNAIFAESIGLLDSLSSQCSSLPIEQIIEQHDVIIVGTIILALAKEIKIHKKMGLSTEAINKLCGLKSIYPKTHEELIRGSGLGKAYEKDKAGDIDKVTKAYESGAFNEISEFEKANGIYCNRTNFNAVEVAQNRLALTNKLYLALDLDKKQQQKSAWLQELIKIIGRQALIEKSLPFDRAIFTSESEFKDILSDLIPNSRFKNYEKQNSQLDEENEESETTESEDGPEETEEPEKKLKKADEPEEASRPVATEKLEEAEDPEINEAETSPLEETDVPYDEPEKTEKLKKEEHIIDRKLIIKIPVTSTDKEIFLKEMVGGRYKYADVWDQITAFINKTLSEMNMKEWNFFDDVERFHELIKNAFDSYATRGLKIGENLIIKVVVQQKGEDFIFKIKDNGAGFEITKDKGEVLIKRPPVTEFERDKIKIQNKRNMLGGAGQGVKMVEDHLKTRGGRITFKNRKDKGGAAVYIRFNAAEKRKEVAKKQEAGRHTNLYKRVYEAQERRHKIFCYLGRFAAIVAAFIPPLSLPFVIQKIINKRRGAQNPDSLLFSVMECIVCAVIPVLSGVATWKAVSKAELKRREKDDIRKQGPVSSQEFERQKKKEIEKRKEAKSYLTKINWQEFKDLNANDRALIKPNKPKKAIHEYKGLRLKSENSRSKIYEEIDMTDVYMNSAQDDRRNRLFRKDTTLTTKSYKQSREESAAIDARLERKYGIH